jgi:HEAT repeat protein
LGLARINHPGTLLLLTDLLRDSDKTARAGAARALGAAGSLAAIPLLRFKVHLGDKEPAVIGECFGALLELAPDESLPFVAGFLEAANEAVQEAALFALAESRCPDGLTLLIEFCGRAPASLKEAALLAIAMFRLPAAIDFLIDLVAQKDAHAAAAISALAIYRHQPKLRERVAAAVTANGEARIARRFEVKFPAEDKR